MVYIVTIIVEVMSGILFCGRKEVGNLKSLILPGCPTYQELQNELSLKKRTVFHRTQAGLF